MRLVIRFYRWCLRQFPLKYSPIGKRELKRYRGSYLSSHYWHAYGARIEPIRWWHWILRPRASKRKYTENKALDAAMQNVTKSAFRSLDQSRVSFPVESDTAGASSSAHEV